MRDQRRTRKDEPVACTGAEDGFPPDGRLIDLGIALTVYGVDGADTSIETPDASGARRRRASKFDNWRTEH